MIDWITILGVGGLGAVASSLVQVLYSSLRADKIRRYQERKEAYIGLLAAWLEDDDQGNLNSNAHNIGHWIFRCQLVGSTSVYHAIHQWNVTSPGSPERSKATQDLQQAMRKDLQ